MEIGGKKYLDHPYFYQMHKMPFGLLNVIYLTSKWKEQYAVVAGFEVLRETKLHGNQSVKCISPIYEKKLKHDISELLKKGFDSKIIVDFWGE